MADNNFDTVKSELDEIYGLLQSLANNISGLNTSAANLRKAADDTSRSAKEVSNSTKSELNEYKTVLGGLAKESKDLTDSIKAGKSLLKDSSSLVDSAQRAIQDSMTFSNKSMSEAFSFGKKVSAYKAQADREIAEAQRNMNNVIEEMDKAIKKMQDAAAANGEAVEDNAEYQKLLAERNAAESRKLEMDNIKEIGYSRVKAQNELKTKAINMLKGAIDTIAAYYQKAFANAYSSVMSAYENTYHDITSYNAYSKKEYNQVIDSMQAFIKENGLNESINMSDYLEEVKGVLQGGLTGPLAEQVAKYSILSKEGGISADFSDQSFQKMIKKVYDQKLQETGSEQEALAASEGLLEQIMTQSKAVIEETGDSFGFANGQINTMMNSIWEMSSIMNMTDEAVKKSTTSMTALNGVLGKTGMDTTAIYEQIEKYASEGFNGSSAQAMLNFSGMSSTQARAEIEKNGIGSMIEKTISGIYDKYSGNAGEFQKAINDALGSDYDLKSIQSMLSTYKTEEDFIKAYKGAMSAAQGANSDAYMTGLKEFNTEAEQLNNYAENAMTDTAQLAQESNLIRIGVDSLVDYFTGNKVSNIFGSIADWGNLLVNAFGKGGGGSIGGLSQAFGGATGLKSGFSNVKAATSLFKEGASFSDVASVGGKGSATLGKIGQVAGKVAPWAMIAAGAAMGVKDSVAAGKSAAANWDSYTGSEKAAAVGNTALAFVTGHNANLSDEEKMQKAKEGKGGLDWGAALKNAGKGALIGGGAGMLASPIGGAIGAVAGAVGGLASNLIQQAVDMKDYNDYAKSGFAKYGESLEETFKKTDKLTASLQEYGAAVSALQESEDKLAAYKNGDLELTDREVALLELEIKKNERLIELKAKELGTLDEIIEANEKSQEVVDQSNAIMTAMESAQKAIDAGGWDSSTNFNDKKQVSDKELNAAISDEEVQKLIDAGVIKDTGDMRKNKIGILQAMTGSKKGKNYFDDVETDMFSMATAKGGTNSTLYKDANTNLENTVSGYTSRADAFLSQLSIANDDYNNEALQNALGGYLENAILAETASGVISRDEAIAAQTKQSVGEFFPNLSEERVTKYTDWLKEHSKATDSKLKGYYKTGLSYVPYDNYLAMLHKGERVQTAAEVNLEKANYAADGSSKMATALQDSLVRQTDIIIGLLQDILGAIGGKSPNASEYMEELNAYSYTVGLPSNS